MKYENDNTVFVIKRGMKKTNIAITVKTSIGFHPKCSFNQYKHKFGAIYYLNTVDSSVFLCWSKSSRCYLERSVPDCCTAHHDCFLFDINQL